MFAILSGLLGCSKSNISEKELKHQEQSVIEQLQTKYPNDTFAVSEYYIDSHLFPQSMQFRASRQDYQSARYLMHSNKYDAQFMTSFEWDENWDKVTVTMDKYPYVLLKQAQKHLLSAIQAEGYVIKVLTDVDYRSIDRPVIDVRNLDDAIDYLKQPQDLILSSSVLVTIPNASTEDYIIKIANDINKQLRILSPIIEVERMNFYSEDQVDLSQVESDNTSSPILNKITDMETYYNIDEPYYRITRRGKYKGKRFGL